MILPKTPYKDIFLAMDREEEKVGFAVRKEEKIAIKKFYKDRPYESLHYKIYEIPSSRNKYLLWFYIPYGHADGSIYYFGNALIIDESDGGRTYICLRTYQAVYGNYNYKVDSLQIYTGHFFSRYRERNHMPASIPTIELVIRFFGRNQDFMTCLDHKKIIKKEHNDDASCWQMMEGVSLGNNKIVQINDKKRITVVRHNTFLSQNDLKQSQLEAIMPKEYMCFLSELSKQTT